MQIKYSHMGQNAVPYAYGCPIYAYGAEHNHNVLGRQLRFKNFCMAKWCQFRLFSVPYITECSYINAQSH